MTTVQPNSSNKIISTPIPKLIISLAIPSTISMLVSTFYQLTDTFFISYLGTAATAAVSINHTLEQSITMLGTFLCVGASSYIARNLGSGNKKKASQTLSSAFFSGFIFGVILMALGLLFLDPLVAFLGATSELHSYCKDYAQYVLLAAPFMIANFVTNKCLYSEGNMVYAMIGMGLGAIINIGLDPLFIFAFQLGIKGASLATAISKLVSFFVLLMPYLRHRTALRIGLHLCSFSKDIVNEIVRIGSPSLLRTALTNAATILLNNLASNYSPAILAGIASSNRVMMLFGTIISGLGQGYQPVVGQNWGAKRFDRVRSSYWFTSFASAITMSAFGFFLFLFAEKIMTLFAGAELNAEMIHSGVLLIRSQSIVLPIHAWVIILTMGYNSTGKALGSAILALSRQGICYIPMLLLLPHLFGADGLVLAQAAADVLSMVLAVPLMISFLRDIDNQDHSTAEVSVK